MTELERYGKWEVVQSISRGGQGQVYLVRDASGGPNTRDRRRNLQNAMATLGRCRQLDFHVLSFVF